MDIGAQRFKGIIATISVDCNIKMCADSADKELSQWMPRAVSTEHREHNLLYNARAMMKTTDKVEIRLS